MFLVYSDRLEKCRVINVTS